MSSYDPFKGYFELNSPFGGNVLDESPIPENCKSFEANGHAELKISPENRPLLGQNRSYSTSSSTAPRFPMSKPQVANRNFDCTLFPNNDFCVTKFQDDGVQTTTLFPVTTTGSSCWGNDAGSWIDLSTEMRPPHVQMSSASYRQNGWERSGNQSWPSTVDLTNGGSTGFYVNTGLESSSDCMSNKSISPPLHDVDKRTNFYPRYYNCTNCDNPIQYGQVEAMVKHFLQQNGVGNSAAFEGNGNHLYRSLEGGRFCAFCKNNKETREFYTTHVVKDVRGKVICPVLRKYTCPICGAKGDNAHTIGHCPVRARQGLMNWARRAPINA